MSLTSAINIGRSGLAANQAAVEVAGNNLSNAATPGYTRQTAVIRAATDVQVKPGLFIGTGARLDSIIRNVDAALMSRMRSAMADHAGSNVRQDVLSQIEAIHNELSETGLGSRLTEFFNSWSELANNTAEPSLRQLVIEQGDSLAEFVQATRGDLAASRNQLDDRINGTVDQANAILDQIAELNAKIGVAEAGLGGANAMRDQRDQLVNDLAKMLDIATVEQSNGSLDVFLNGIPLVTAGENRGLAVDFATPAGGEELGVRLRLGDDGTYLTATSGSIGQMIESRTNDVLPALEALDNFATALIREVNRVHSQGQGAELFLSVTGGVQVADAAAPLTRSDAELDFVPGHGTFALHVTQQSTGTRTTTQINLDADGIGGPDMSLNDLAAAIDAVVNVSASVTVDGRLQIDADSPDFAFSFSDDASGVLTSLGVNTFFSGHDATDIGVSQTLANKPALLATTQNHVAGGNGTALAIAGLAEQPLDGLGGQTLGQMWSAHVEDYAVRAERATLDAQSDQTILESLQAQREGVSGVSVDEEAINLMAFQRAYQGSARFLNVVNELMDTLLGLVR